MLWKELLLHGDFAHQIISSFYYVHVFFTVTTALVGLFQKSVCVWSMTTRATQRQTNVTRKHDLITFCCIPNKAQTSFILLKMANSAKGNSVMLATFKKWDLEDAFGNKTEEKDDKIMVNYVWCKICAANKTALLQHPNCKGSVKNAILSFINGTTFVTKHTLQRHLSSEGHKIAKSCEQSKPASDRLQLPSSQCTKIAKVTTHIFYFSNSFHSFLWLHIG